ncbi:hypothetical protein Cni_G15851 [Canna indica]|uniref:Wall-associated receptor kinase galacturonan-binding domain-containing protein n=1 Tax=Canna indica TaxID=4628 RepID=A0AAQ3KF30_9LILI|nr:hypothetical protein Cni_G15851 [Canna indica]
MPSPPPRSRTPRRSLRPPPPAFRYTHTLSFVPLSPPSFLYKTHPSPNGAFHLHFPSTMSPPPLLGLLFFLSLSAAQTLGPNRCGERCGALAIPFPFYLNASCGPSVPAFRLSCSASDSVLRLSLPSLSDLRLITFLPSGSLVLDYSSHSSSCDRWYADVNHSFGLDGSSFFAITADNLLRLYDCEDSSICRGGCDRVGAPGASGCEGNRTDFGCCYPLSDGSVWKVGSGFSVFGEFGCRGFSSWAVVRSASGDGTTTAQRGIKVEWAVPKGHGNGTECAEGAVVVKATAVRGAVRCACGPGFIGDGFAAGTGCSRSFFFRRTRVFLEGKLIEITENDEDEEFRANQTNTKEKEEKDSEGYDSDGLDVDDEINLEDENLDDDE